MVASPLLEPILCTVIVEPVLLPTIGRPALDEDQDTFAPAGNPLMDTLAVPPGVQM